MIEDNNKEFDLRVRSMMESAEEEVPSNIWDAIDRRLPHKNPVLVPAWLKFFGVAFATAAAIALTLTFTGSFGETDSSILINETEDTILADIPETIIEQPVEEQIIKRERVRIEAQTEISEENNFADVPYSEYKYKPSVEEKQTHKKEVKEDGNTAGMTPEEIEAYFNSPEEKSSSKKISLDIKGTFGSNDGVSQKSIITGYFGSPTKDNLATTGVYESSTSVYSVPVSYNIGARFYLTKRLSLGTGISFTRLSRNFKGEFMEANAERTSYVRYLKDADIINRQYYIGVPINIYYDFLQTDFIQFYGFGGAEFEKGLSDKYMITANAETANFSKAISGIQSSVAAGLGLQFCVIKDLSIFIDPSVRYYFDCNQPSSVRTAKPFMFNFEVGARFNLKKY